MKNLTIIFKARLLKTISGRRIQRSASGVLWLVLNEPESYLVCNLICERNINSFWQNHHTIENWSDTSFYSLIHSWCISNCYKTIHIELSLIYKLTNQKSDSNYQCVKLKTILNYRGLKKANWNISNDR